MPMISLSWNMPLSWQWSRSTHALVLLHYLTLARGLAEGLLYAAYVARLSTIDQG